MKDTGNSSPSSFFWVSTVAIEWSEANVYKINSLSKFGLCKVGSYAMASLIFSNASFLSFAHLQLESFLIISCSGLTISAKLEMNLLTEFIFLIKDCIAFLLWGNTIALMDSIVHGSIVIPSGENVCAWNSQSILPLSRSIHLLIRYAGQKAKHALISFLLLSLLLLYGDLGHFRLHLCGPKASYPQNCYNIFPNPYKIG